MGKKTTEKKRHEKEKKKNEEPSILREASRSKNKLSLTAEHEAKLHLEDKENKESGHGISDDGVEFEASQSKAPIEVDVDVKKKKKKKKTKTCETSGDNVESSAFENESVIKVDVNDDIVKKKKNEKRHENGGNDIDLSVRESEAVKESNVDKDKEKKQDKKLLEVSGNAVKCGANQNDVVIEGDVHMDKKKKSKHNHEASVVEGQTNPKQGDIIESMNGENVDQKKKKRCKRDQIDEDITLVNNLIDVETGKERENLDEKTMENLVNSRKKKKRKKNCSDDVRGNIHTRKETPKKVSFSNDVEVFPPANGSTCGLVRGKRFSQEEDEMVKNAVLCYIESRGLGEEGLNMVLNCRSHPEVKNCWKEIGAALPWRPYQSIYYRAHIIFEKDENCKWSPEELELVRKFHEKHGADWKQLAGALGKHRFHVKDAWQRIKLPNMKKGQWSQEEYQNLFDLMNLDLRLRASEEKKSKHGMLRDNISWEAISDKLTTRSNALCCQKWYY